MIYVSIPKTGSQSVHEALGTNRKYNHLPIRDIPKGEFTFCFLREPVQRLRSWFYFHITKYPNLIPIYGDSINKWIMRDCPHHWEWDINPLYQWEFISIEGHLKVTFAGDFARMGLQLNRIAGVESLPKIGRSTKKKETISQSSLKKLRGMFPMDFELYEIIKRDGYIGKYPGG